MKKLLLTLSLLFAAIGTALMAADPPKDPAPPIPNVIVPDGPTPPMPPAPPLNTPVKLGADQLYIVRANVVCTIHASPAGLVKVTAEKGPLRVKAKFVDGDGTYQCRTFTEPNLYIVEAVGAGPCELDIVPAGAMSDADWVIRTLAVNGVGPTPPGPGPGPTDPLSSAIQAAYLTETDAAKASNAVALASIYRAGIGLQNITSPPKTYADLFSMMLEAAAITMPKGALPKVQAVVSADLQSALGKDMTQPINWTATAKEFQRVADILNSLGGK